MTTKKILELKEQISARRPEFVQQDHHKRKETKARWRRPKGLHSKMRHGVWGRPASVKPGYRGPAEARGMHRNGLIPVHAETIAELMNIDPKKQGIILGHVGARRKMQMLDECKKKGITVLNVKNVDEAMKAIADKAAARKEAKKTSAQKKEEKAKPKEAEKKEEAPATKEQERKEMEKVLTKREG